MSNFLSIDDDGDLTFRLLVAERALADAEAQYQRFADALPYGIWTCGPDGELLHISESFLDLVGMTLEECQRFGWWEKLPADEIEPTRAHWKHCLLNALPYDQEHDFLGQDGVRHAVLVRGVPVKDDLGRVISWVGINLDIDDRRRAQAELRESESRFRTMADEAPVLIWMTGANGVSSYYNRRWIELTGVSLDEQLGRGWLSHLHPEDSERTLAVFRAAFERRQPFENTYRILDRDGNYRKLLDRGVPRFLEDGSFAGYVGCSTDITEMEEARKTTAFTSERYRVVCNALRALVYDADLESGNAQYSVGLYDLIGIRHDQAEPTVDWWRSRVHPDDLKRVEESVWMQISVNEIYELEYRVLDSNGRYLPVLDRGVRQIGSNGSASRLIGCITSIADTRSSIPGPKSHDLLKTVVECSPTAAFLVDPSGNSVYANLLALDLFGCVDEAFGAQWNSLISAKRGVIAREWSVAAKHTKHLSAEFELVRPDGHKVVLQLELEPMRDGKGVLEGFMGLLADVSQRKRDQERLEQSEALYRSLAESSPNHVFSRLPNGEADFVSGSWCEYTGLTLEESLGKGWMTAFHPDDLALIDFKAEEPYDLEQRVRSRDGDYRWFLIRRNPVRDSKGNIVKWQGTCTDIHDLKMSKEAHLQSELRMNAAMDLTGLVLFNMDLNLRYTWIQGPVKTQISGDEIVGKSDFDLLDQGQAEMLTRLKNRVIRHGENIRQTIHVDYAGLTNTYDLMMKPLKDQSGAIIGLTGAAIDQASTLERAARAGKAAISAI